jgi:hypothetical protein
MEEEVKGSEVMDPFNIDLSLLEGISESLSNSFAQEEDIKEKIKQEDTVAEETKEQHEVLITEDDDKGVPSSHDTKEPSPFIPYAKLLVEEGITPNFKLEEFDGTPQGLLKAVQDEIQYGIESYKETNLHPRIKWLQDNLDEGVAFEELLKVDSQRISLNNVKPEEIDNNADIQKEVVRQYYKETTRFNDATINKAIERLEATGDLGEESKTFFEELKQINSVKEQQLVQQAQMQKQAQVKAQQEALATFKKTLDSKKEIVTGITLTPIMKDAIYKTLTTPVDTDPQTGMPLNEIAKARQADPMNFEINLAYIYKATKGFTDWSVFSGTGKKAAIREFEDSVKKLDFTQTKQTITKPDVDKDLIEQMELISKMARNY